MPVVKHVRVRCADARLRQLVQEVLEHAVAMALDLHRMVDVHSRALESCRLQGPQRWRSGAVCSGDTAR